MTKIEALDPCQKPPESIRASYKFYHKLHFDALEEDPGIIDFSRGLSVEQAKKCNKVDQLTHETVTAACVRFGYDKEPDPRTSPSNTPIFEQRDLPGLFLIPSLIPQQTQQNLLSCLLHETLADPRHKTNVHAHHRIPYSAAHLTSNPAGLQNEANGLGTGLTHNCSFFNIPPDSLELLTPVNSSAHRAITVSEFLHRKLRWLTLGGQYDWTQKMYPNKDAPPFPEAIANLLQGLFPETRPEAAIVNIYTPGDTLSVHRDVSEDSDNGLVSISLGCDGIFIAGIESEDDDIKNNNSNQPAQLVVRLRSGDAVYMTGQARFAWHGVPQVIPETCPPWLGEWPAAAPDAEPRNDGPDRHEAWRGWMKNKRVNLNVRQMRD